ncbi:MAG: hypothetical protein EOQ28_13615 [Mesorhizobium sp.]|nr:MAG: hypothetical protein EOQ28_13615 [Mesorhizobium sp.]RWC05165.1 MAG: hypothetical protein EOQ57_01965 [Mesorhizobium sp.]RWK09666.1 MAG: hypothetical protein EOR42_02930 [Mesorhizobium sp.]RWK13262.1 MAG: hypothetical protein EOR39_01490 [Mesorhizobium sp.]TIQ45054.1 MAG: hypothetical protein E5X47_27535 [Mesorhizobium sp.]
MTKLSDLAPPLSGTLWIRPAAEEEDHFHLCRGCGQAVDERDLRQVQWHQQPAHRRLDLDS